MRVECRNMSRGINPSKGANKGFGTKACDKTWDMLKRLVHVAVNCGDETRLGHIIWESDSRVKFQTNIERVSELFYDFENYYLSSPKKTRAVRDKASNQQIRTIMWTNLKDFLGVLEDTRDEDKLDEWDFVLNLSECIDLENIGS